MWSSSERWVRASRELRTRIDSPRRAWLLLRMVGWWSGLVCLRPFAPLKWMLRLVTPGEINHTLQAADVEQCILWLDSTGVWRRQGACLPRALVCRRFLSLAGLEPTLLVGFNGEVGHAWVEVEGAAFQESGSGDFRAVLMARPGSIQVERVEVTRPGG